LFEGAFSIRAYYNAFFDTGAYVSVVPKGKLSIYFMVFQADFNYNDYKRTNYTFLGKKYDKAYLYYGKRIKYEDSTNRQVTDTLLLIPYEGIVYASEWYDTVLIMKGKLIN
jgi:hypothetical protein